MPRKKPHAVGDLRKKCTQMFHLPRGRKINKRLKLQKNMGSQKVRRFAVDFQRAALGDMTSVSELR